MPSTPLIACSSGLATVSAMTVRFATGYFAFTITVGGTTSGYSLIGSCGNAIRPARKIRAESTPAKIGRLMKNCESFMISMHHVKGNGRLGNTRDRIGRACGRCRVRRLHARLGGYLAEAARGIAHGNARGSDTLPGPHMLQTVDDDEFVRSQSLRHDAQAVDFGTEFHEAILDAVVLAQRQHEFLGKIRTDGAILDEDAVAILPADEPHTCKQARRVAAV